MKKNIVITFLVLIASLFFHGASYGADCYYNPEEWDTTDVIISALWDCIEWSKVVWADWDNLNLDVKRNEFSDNINAWTNNIAIALSILAVASIVFGSLQMTLSAWEDEKITKAKDIVKWWIIWFIGVISASSIIKVLVAVIYGIWG